MRELYGLGYVLKKEKEKIVFSSELGSETLDNYKTFVLTGKGKINISALLASAERGITLSLRRGFDVLRFEYPSSPSLMLRSRQIETLRSDGSLEIAAEIVRASSLNKLWIVRFLKSIGYEVDEEESEIERILQEKPSSLEPLRRIEARITVAYHEALRKALDPSYGFKSRTRRPPKDCVSAAMSYGYMKLYRYMEATLLAEGFDPRIGYLHVPSRQRPSLALDMAEPFRQPVVDSALLTLLLNKDLNSAKDFRREGEAVYLGVRGRKKVDVAIRKKLELKVNGVTLLGWMKLQAVSLKAYLAGEGVFKAFTIPTR